MKTWPGYGLDSIMQVKPITPLVSELPMLLQRIKAFYIYKQEGLKKALHLFPNSKLFIEENAKKSFDEVKHDLIEGIMKMQVVPV